MRVKRQRLLRAGLVAAACIAIAAAGLMLTSCGSDKTTGSKSTTKLPPGVTGEDASQTSTANETAPQSTPTAESQGTAPAAQAANPARSAELYGARFTVVGATRPDSNKSAVSSGGREVKGDYLEVELTVANAATDHLVDLSEYSFRLLSPGIAASTYENYYGNTGTYGDYVDEDEISASLLSYTDLQPVAYKVKVGEEVTDVFLFFDLNPENVGRNPNVTKDNSNLVIHKVSGTDYGEEVSIPLAGYPD